MKLVLLSILFLVFSSCASTSARKSITYSGLAGCAAGGAGGYVFSPDGRKNKRNNTALFCLIGAGVAAVTGYLLHKDDPTNRQLTRSKDISGFNSQQDINYQLEVGRSNLNITPQFTPKEVFKINDSDIPDSLRSRLPRQRVIVHEVQEQRINKNGEYILIEPHRAFIYTTENQ